MKISTLIRMLETCMDSDHMLTDWERNFIDSLDHIGYRAIRTDSPLVELSPRQEQTLFKIHSRVTGV